MWLHEYKQALLAVFDEWSKNFGQTFVNQLEENSYIYDKEK